MTTKIVEPSNISEALDKLTSLSLEFPQTEFVFRGQQCDKWPLQTSYERYWGGKAIYNDLSTSEFFVDRMVAQFRSGVIRLGLQGPEKGNLEWLEFGRHHGLPTPLLDFTWSPFVALFFAFDGLRAKHDSNTNSVVYCLNLNSLAAAVARDSADEPTAHRAEVQKFLHEGHVHFESGFPVNELLFIRYPSANTRRMLVQLGTFLYCTKPFSDGSEHPQDLEEYFAQISESSKGEGGIPVLTKIKIPHAWSREVFSRLEIMSITGASMYLSAEGVARDVFNAFHFHPRAAFLREEFGS
jgi:FRG domain